MFIFIAFCVLFAIFFILFAFYKAARGFSAPLTECPACGRNIRIYGNAPKCYKCHTELFKHKEGHYIARK